MASASGSGFTDFEDEFSDYEDFLATLTEVIQSEINEETCSVCVCGLHSVDRMIICSKPSCVVKYFHEDCVGPIDIHRDWFCDNCKSSQQIGNVQPSQNQPTAEAPTSMSPESEVHLPVEVDNISVDVQAPGEDSATTNPSTTPSQSRRMKYPKRRYGKEDATARAEFYTKSALEVIFTSPLFKMQTVLVAKVITLANSVKDSLGNEEVRAFFQKLTRKLWKRVASVARGRSWTEECKGDMWQAFQVLRTKPKLLRQWKLLLEKLDIRREDDEELFLLQHLLDNIFQQIMHEMMQKDLPQIVQPLKERTPDESEIQALRYAAGYIPVKLIRRYKKLTKNATAAAFVDVLTSWAEENIEDAPTFVDFSKLWLEKQNRGGLFLVTDSVFEFFKAMELVVGRSLHKDNIDLFQAIDLQVALFNNLCTSTEVSQSWEKISNKLSPARSEKLFQEVARSFLKMRCEAFVKVYIMIRKQKEHDMSKKGERSLRKELAK